MNVGIVGASGYGGGELLRWLALHPYARVKAATSNTYAGKPVSAAFPGMAGRVDLDFLPDSLEALAGCDLIFLARDNGVAMALAPEILKGDVKVIDLSADFRFRNPAEYEAWYKIEHKSPQITMAAVYGLPELHGEEIKNAQIVGNPGCYTTASILALAPLVKSRLIDPDSIVIDGKSGISGAGRSKFGLDYHFSEANESVSAYKVAGTHRHTGEIEQELSILADRPMRVSFTPHLIPMTRGILASCYARLDQNLDAAQARELYRTFYRNAPFVHISEALPATKYVTATNMCHIGMAIDSRTNRITVISAIDNLGKGMAGQAIQNMNLMCGFKETAGLESAGLWP